MTFILFASGVSWWYFSPTQTIKRTTVTLLKSISISKKSGTLSRSGKADEFKKHLADKVRIQSAIEEINGQFSQDHLIQGHAYLLTKAHEIEFEYNKISVDNITRTSATASALLIIKPKMPRFNNSSLKAHCQWSFKKTDGDWKLYNLKIEGNQTFHSN